MPGAQPVATALAQARAAFKPGTPESALPGLLAARAALSALPENPWKAEKLAAIEQAIVACAGLFAEVTSATPTATPGSEVSLTATALLRRPVAALVGAVRLETVQVFGAVHAAARELREGLLVEDKYSVTVPQGTSVRGPHWLETPALPGLRAPRPSCARPASCRRWSGSPSGCRRCPAWADLRSPSPN